MSPALIEWLSEQHPWLQIAANRLVCNGTLSDQDIVEITTFLKDPTLAIEAQLAVAPAATPATGAGEVRLLSLGPVEGIDALAPRAPLNFGTTNLVVVYGLNGSGKSGYTRIICKACGKPTAGNLRSDVFAATPARQTCKIKFSVGPEVTEVDWSPGSPIAALAAVDVFDTTCGRVYIENETEATFLPPDLSLLKDLVEACGRISTRLLNDEQQLVNQLPTIEAALATTQAAISLRNLRYDTTEDAITARIGWTPENQLELDSVNASIAIADPLVAAAKRRRTKVQREALVALIESAIAHLSGDEFGITVVIIATAKQKRRIADEAAEALRSASAVNGIGSETWRALWNAARDFAAEEAYPFTPFPPVGETDRCVLCHQELSEDARARLRSFEECVAGTIQAEATTAERNLATRLAEIPSRPDVEAVTTSAEAAGLSADLTSALEAAWARLETALEPLRRGNAPEQRYQISEEETALLNSLRELVGVAETEAQELTRSADPVARRAAENRQKELRASKWVSEQATAVRAEVERLKQVHRLQEWRRQTNTQGISRKATDLSQTLVTEAYINRFNTELTALGARNLKVELVLNRTDRGRAKHIIRLRDAETPEADIGEILSEGERRIISLAAFLADVTGRLATAPFIFDDPISSLDQTWEERTIDRLIALSANRQVIVFTHRLSLLGLVTDKTDAEDLTAINIRREDWGTGQPGELPLYGKNPESALNSLKNSRVGQARNVLRSEGHDAYYPLAKAICSDLRVTLERLIENTLLSDVIQRHRRSLKTLNKIQRLALINANDCTFIEAMMTKYSRFEHSQTAEAPVQLPTPEEFTTDLDELLTWNREFMRRHAP